MNIANERFYIAGPIRQPERNQGNRCAICKNEFRNSKDMNVDHNHVDGKIRGLLCRRCNLGLGRWEDNPSFFDNASKYLRDQK